MKRSTTKAAIVAVLVVGGLLSSSCGWDGKTIASRSPAGDARLEIQQKLPAVFEYAGFRVVLTANRRTTVIKEHRGDTSFQFAEVYWASDGTAVAVYAAGISRLRLAFSLTERREVPFDVYAAKVAAKIRADYGLPAAMKDEDVFSWADVYGVETFHKRHPRLELK